MSSATLNKMFKIISILFGCLAITWGDCEIQLTSELLQRPKIFQEIGTQRIHIQISDNENYLRLFDNQKVDIVCDTEFEGPESSENTIQITCSGTNLQIDLERYYYSSYNGIFQCSPLKWKLYEASENFNWCPNNVTSYLLARPMTSASNYEYLAGVCYDTYKNSLKTLYYKMTPKNDDSFHPTVLEQFYQPINEIKHHRDIFIKRSVNEENYDNYVFKDWIKFSKFNSSSILQIPRINRQFYAGTFLDVIWWPSLRLGNWKRYEMALEKHIENTNKSYHILAGMSGVVEAPIIENCSNNFTWKVLNDNLNNQIPLYVWNYLRATDNSSEIVVIGVNSPFYEFYKEEDIVFCKDKCQEISWLKTEASAFRYSALGVIFCCSVDEIKSSKQLSGFATIELDSLPEQIVSEQTVPFTTTSENEYELE